jgi:hypothetical protein
MLEDPWLSVPVSRQVWLYPQQKMLQKLFRYRVLHNPKNFKSDIFGLSLRS